MTAHAPTKQPAFNWFFPAASLLAALLVPLSVWSGGSGSGWPPGLLGAGHGHELIFGFALALVAGYTLGPQPRRILLPLFGLWLLARLSWLLLPGSTAAGLLTPAFALTLAWLVVPRFNAAKKWRNKLTGPLILLICLLAAGYWLIGLVDWRPGGLLPDRRQLMQGTVLGLLLLMTFMGGRIIAPAVAGTLEKKGIALEARVQPRIEGALLVLLGGALVLTLIPSGRPLAGALLVAAAALIVVRTLRWQLWRCPERPDLLVFGIGYLWLAAGSLLSGIALLTAAPLAPALHLITVAALGTLSTSVMLRLAWQRSQRCFPRQSGTAAGCCAVRRRHHPLPGRCDAIRRTRPAVAVGRALERRLSCGDIRPYQPDPAGVTPPAMIGYLHCPCQPQSYPIGDITGASLCF